MQTLVNVRSELPRVLSGTLCLMGMLMIMAQPALADDLRESIVAAGLNENVYLLNGASGMDLATLSLLGLDKQEGATPVMQVTTVQNDHLRNFYNNPASGYNGQAGLPLTVALAAEELLSASPVTHDALRDAPDPVWELVEDVPAFGYEGPSAVTLGIRVAIEKELAS